MPIMSVEIMKIIDEREMQKATRRMEPLVKGWELNDFVVHLN